MRPTLGLLLILLFAVLLTGCNESLVASQPVQSTETQLPLLSPVIPTDTPQPVFTPTESLPTTTPVDVPAPTSTNTLPPIPSGPRLERLPIGTEPFFTQLHMVDPLSGWAAGGLDGSTDHLFITRDGGAHWSDVTPPQPVDPGAQDVTAFFLDAATAWATYSSLPAPLPSYPVVWHTSDAGQTWQPSQLLDLSGLEQSYVTDLYFVDMQNGWLLTHVGVGMSHDYVTLFRTSDGGLTWTRLLDPYNDGQIQICQKTGLFFLDSQVGWLTGDCGGVMAGVFLTRTEDGGLTWTYVELPAPADNLLLFDVNTPVACGSDDLRFFDSQVGVLGVHCTLYDSSSSEPTFADYLYTTLDGGATWSSTSYPGGALAFVSPLNGWALSRDIYQTADGGLTWNLVNDVHWDARFNFITPEFGWAASYTETEHALVATTDGGAHWFMLEPVIVP